MIEEVFQLNGEYVVKTTCCECEVEIHSPVGADAPSEIVVSAALAFRRMCEDCLRREEEAREVADRRRRSTRLIIDSQMPAALRDMKFVDMIRGGRRDAAIAACERWAHGEFDKRGVYLVGDAGVGKTRLAATAAWAFLLAGVRPWRGAIRWCSIAQLMGNLNRTFADKERRKAIEILLGEDPLVLDDFDKVNPTDFGRQQVFTAIDARVQANVPLIVTANLSLDAISEKFGDPVASRLAGHCVQFVLDGPDRRLELDVA